MYTFSLNPIFFMLSTVKSFEIFLKQKGYDISEFFFLSSPSNINRIFSLHRDCSIMQYTCGPSSRTRIFFFCCQCAFINYFSYQKQHHFYPIIQSTRKIVNVHQIQYQNHYVIFTRITIPSWLKGSKQTIA